MSWGIIGGFGSKALNNFNWPLPKDAYNQSLIDSKAGTDLTNEGLGGLRDLDKRYQDLIAAGGLTPELKKKFDVARGYLNDQYTRGGRSLSAALASRRAQSGGALTPGAVAEMEKQGGAQRDEQFFDASNQLTGQEADLGYKSTMDLYKSIEGIRTTITQTGLTREQQAMMAKLQSLSLMLERRKAIASYFKLF